MNGRLLCGRYIYVKWFLDKEKRPCSSSSSALVNKPDNKKSQATKTLKTQSLVGTSSQIPDKPRQSESNQIETGVVDVISSTNENKTPGFYSEANVSLPIVVSTPLSDDSKPPAKEPVAPPDVTSGIAVCLKKKSSNSNERTSVFESKSPCSAQILLKKIKREDCRSSSTQKGIKMPLSNVISHSQVESKTCSTTKKTQSKNILNISTTRTNKKIHPEHKLTSVEKKKTISVSESSKEDIEKKNKASSIKPVILKSRKKHSKCSFIC
jgi:hypothetical protein